MNARNALNALLIWLALGVGLVYGQETSDQEAASRAYRIQPGDTLSVLVRDLPEFAWEGDVDTAGNVSLPFIDKPLPALCQTSEVLGRTVKQEYQRFIKRPEVSVKIVNRRTVATPPVFVTGAVQEPGRFLLNRRVLLSEVLAAAGGLTKLAGKNVRVVATTGLVKCNEDGSIFRRTADNLTAAVYALAAVGVTAGPDNPVIYEGDVVTVLESDLVYVDGAVRQPAPLPFTGRLSALQAIKQAGGLLPENKAAKARLVRRPNWRNGPVEIILDLDALQKGLVPDVLLESNDVLYVPAAKEDLHNVVLCSVCTQTLKTDAMVQLQNSPLKVIE